MIFVRDGVEERHEFEARPHMGWQDMAGMMPLIAGPRRGQNEDLMAARAVQVIDRLVRRTLANDDGTPEKWRPNVYTDDGDGRQYFNDPQGNKTPVDLLPGVEAFDAGSSRRRWVHLMEDDDEVTIEMDQMVSLMEDLITAASHERPTQRSEPSSL